MAPGRCSGSKSVRTVVVDEHCSQDNEESEREPAEPGDGRENSHAIGIPIAMAGSRPGEGHPLGTVDAEQESS